MYVRFLNNPFIGMNVTIVSLILLLYIATLSDNVDQTFFLYTHIYIQICI